MKLTRNRQDRVLPFPAREGRMEPSARECGKRWLLSAKGLYVKR